MPIDIVPTGAAGLPAKASTAVNSTRSIRVKLLEHLGLTQRASSPKTKERAMLEAREQESFASYDSADPIDVTVGALHDMGNKMRSRRHVLGGLAALPIGAAVMPAAAASPGVSAATGNKDAALIAECARVEALAHREYHANRRLADVQERFQAASPVRPIIPLSDGVLDSEPLKLLRAKAAAVATSTREFAADNLADLRGRIERLEAYHAERAALSRRFRIDAAIDIAERRSEQLVAAAQSLTFMRPSTIEGLHAKAGAWLTLRRLAPRDQSFEWSADLAEKVLRETLMFGGGIAS